MKTYLLVLASVIILSGCQLTRVEGEVEGVDVRLDTNQHHDSGDHFCPPGQAKKGNC